MYQVSPSLRRWVTVRPTAALQMSYRTAQKQQGGDSLRVESFWGSELSYQAAAESLREPLRADTASRQGEKQVREGGWSHIR